MTIFNYINEIPDPRCETNKKHELMDVIFLTFAAVLSGASGWKAIQQFGECQLPWLRQHSPFANGIPKRHCIANIIKALDSQSLMSALLSWINERRSGNGRKQIAIDGKTLRGTGNGFLAQALHVVSAYDIGNGIALYQQLTERKGKEGPVARQLIECLSLENATVTLDALHCQVETLQLICQRKGEFIVGIKGNQKKLYEFVKQRFSSCYDDEGLATHSENNQAHGRTEYRQVMQIDADLPEELKQRWPTIRTLIEVVSERGERGKVVHRESRWYVSSLAVDARVASQMIREHWCIENQLHWVLDVVFREDEMNLKDPEGAAHMALFNRVALSVLKQHEGKKDSIAGKRQCAGWSGDFRSEVIFG
ncbi:ISAs1 family transposase [Pectobacterium carotovorum]|nr:ISAs1 family transposase [Pectobacterium carotovorum]QQG29569.1 ISAs1 family transposase [Pectobacterium carotovorum]QQG30107.1 ISAs1 family transposase [Pectobacterium carotovorum]